MKKRDKMERDDNNRRRGSSTGRHKRRRLREMGNLVDHSFDMSDRKFIEPVVDYILGAIAKEA